MLKLVSGGMDWIDLACDRDLWRAHLNALVNVGVTQNSGNFLTCEGRVNLSRRTLMNGVNYEYFILAVQPTVRWAQKLRRSLSVACFNNSESASLTVYHGLSLLLGLISLELAMISALLFLFVFGHILKIAKSDHQLCHVCRFVRLTACSRAWTRRRSHWTDFHEI